MTRYDLYALYLLRHKRYVFKECAKQGLYWRGLVHDWSKFLPDEFIPYARHFYQNRRCAAILDASPPLPKRQCPNIVMGKRFCKDHDDPKTGYVKEADVTDRGFNLAWARHWHRNRHHWQWYVVDYYADGTFRAERMGLKDLVEMVCDWRGAGRAQGYGDNTKEWYRKQRPRIILHPDTRDLVDFMVFGSEVGAVVL